MLNYNNIFNPGVLYWLMIRLFMDSDGESCREIFKRCFSRSVVLDKGVADVILGYLAREGLIESESKKYPLLVYEHNCKVLGLGGLNKNHITKLYVHPDFHSRGVGKMILNFIEERAKLSGESELIAQAYLNSVPFYHRQGYVLLGTFEHQYDVVIKTFEMRKDI